MQRNFKTVKQSAKQQYGFQRSVATGNTMIAIDCLQISRASETRYQKLDINLLKLLAGLHFSHPTQYVFV